MGMAYRVHSAVDVRDGAFVSVWSCPVCNCDTAGDLLSVLVCQWCRREFRGVVGGLYELVEAGYGSKIALLLES